MIRKFILAATLAAAFGSIATPATAALIMGVAPPPPHDEVIPPPRDGHVWRDGHWELRNRQHHWVSGTWLRERRGYHYNQPAWVERDGRWYMERGRWGRGDRDADGVPNRQDMAPNNPNRY